MSTLLNALERWRPFRAVVLGDFMLDELVFGNADRLCPDAPVPILHVQRSEQRPGGAANVCLDLAAFHASVRAVGVVGAATHHSPRQPPPTPPPQPDDAGSRLVALLHEASIDPSGLVADPARPTTIKRSLIGLAQHRHPQKMFRMDLESRDPISADAEDRLIAVLVSALDAAGGAHCLCIEDYNKGVCSTRVCRAAIDAARARSIPVFVDPAAIADYSKYRGASAITPNRVEALLAASDAAPRDRSPPDAPEAYAPVAQRLVDSLDLDAAIITLDRHGALLLERADGRSPRSSPPQRRTDPPPGTNDQHTPMGTDTAERDLGARVVPTAARQVYDVTGAGDMVLAALAAARANNASWLDAVRFANAAAGLEVEVFGVVPIPLEKVHREILLRERSTRGKLRTHAEAAVEAAALRKDGRRLVFTNGCFDVLHAGHVSLLRRARELGDALIVALNSDDSVRRLKGPQRPVYPEADRAELLGELACVDAVVIFDDDTPESLIKRLNPDVLVKGAEYAADPDSIPGAPHVRAAGGSVVLLDMVPGKSTSRTVERIRSTPAAQLKSAPAPT